MLLRTFERDVFKSKPIMADVIFTLFPFAPADEELSRIESELERLTCTLPRESIIRQSLSKSFTVRVRNLEEAISFSNGYAPEHLIVNIKDAARYVWTNGLARLVPLP
jgi:histidinol dehydrogenase